jgi:methionyl aminopeptidase
MITRVKTEPEIAAMRESGRMLATVLGVLRRQLAPGMTTKELADIAARELQALGGKPAFKGYHGFPEVLCVSVNAEVVHGIPNSRRVVQAGDIVSMDFGVVHRGMITDSAISIIAGGAQDTRVAQLVAATERALYAGIDAVKNNAHVGDIGASVQAVLDKNGFGIVRELVGHGVGHNLHEDPNIPNYGRKGTGFRLRTGMTVAIEPMATLGSYEVYVADDGWTVLTRDHSLSAHFEHTILVTGDGAEILTTL